MEWNNDVEMLIESIIQSDPRKNLACDFPKVPLHNEDVKPFVKTEDNITCPMENDKMFEVQHDGYLVRLLDPAKYNFKQCCYMQLARIREGLTDINPRCLKITKQVTKIPDSFDYIAIRCFNKKTKKVQYVDMFPMTHVHEIQPPVPATTDDKNQHKMNIIILGLDATSNLNFKRIMPKTLEYMTKNLSSIGLQWLNKNGDNTLPNVMTALTGYSVPEMRNRGWEDPSNYFDECPFIWKRFAKEGYLTVLGEDLSGISTFSYNKAGFIDKPTDFYLRPLTVVQEKHLKSNWLSHLPACFGPRMSSEVLINWMQRLTTAFEEKRRNYFQFFWSMSLTHSSLNQGAVLDDLLLSTFQWFNERNYLNNTVFILMSDHGFRFGGYRNTYFGDIENKMPFAYFISALIGALPEHRIESRQKKLKLGKKVPKSISLFLPVPESRTCQTSGVPQEFCICNSLPKITNFTTSYTPQFAKFLTDQINKIVSRNPHCLKLELGRIVTANGFLNEELAVDNGLEYLHSVTIMTVPGQATFEATMRNVNATRQEIKDDYVLIDDIMAWTVVGDITRTNSYGNDSLCVKEEALKLYCFCKK
ncbi:hypothetical protein Ocin01_18459 [Orchesella cincta]|uniref:DUF229 domain containing protein n=1 Tax=Orchesella cincta TaxID=48709 RepID=A0A1D2M5N6_ORCCI|nr:hypothetical protein Ocin01_18459 [Orchesella cincta]